MRNASEGLPARRVGTITRALALLLPPFALSCLLAAAAGCGVDSGPSVPVHLADLAAYAHFYDGRRIEATGTVHRIADPEHYWIEDDALNRVRIEPGSRVAGLIGQRVRVSGRFRYDPREGRSLEARRVTAMDAAAPDAAAGAAGTGTAAPGQP